MRTGLVLLLLSSPGGQSPERELIAAARAGDIAGLHAGLTAGASVNARDSQGRTALMHAALRHDRAMVEWLLAAGADPNLQDDLGDTALLLEEGRDPLVLHALVDAGADVNLANHEGRTPLIAAAAQPDPQSVQILLGRGAAVSQRDRFGVSALTVARASGASATEAVLRAAGGSESQEERLHAAIREGDESMVRQLISTGADVDALDTDRYETALMSAVRHRQMEVLLILLEAGADPLAEGNGIETTGENAVLEAARAASPWALQTMIAGRTAAAHLERALFAGCAHAGVLRVLLEAGAPVDARGPGGTTPLMCAASSGSSEAVLLLLQSGANPRLPAADGASARELAEAAGHREVAAILERAERIR